MSYISKRAKVSRTAVIGECVVLGRSMIGDYSFIDNEVIIGYPTRKKILDIVRHAKKSDTLYEIMDGMSEGTEIGSNVLIRRGTVVYERVKIGEGVETGHNVLIREDTTVGKGTRIGSSTIIDGRVTIGNEVNIQSGVYIPPMTLIKDRVFLGPFVTITNDRYPPSSRLSGVVIEEEVVVGAGAVLLAGIKIGRGAVVGAGAVVTKDVDEKAVVVGVPSKPVSSRYIYELRKKMYQEGRLEYDVHGNR